MKLKQICSFLLVVSVLLSLCACGSSSLVCKNCGEEYEEGDLYCPSCGEKIQTSTLCSKGHENPSEAKFCGQCGEALGSYNIDGDGDANNGEQDDSANVWLKVKSNTNGDSYAYQYYYNYAGQLVSEKIYFVSNNKTDRIFNYSYDEHGQLVLKNLSYNSTGSTRSWTYTNEYDENGNLISVTDGYSVVTKYKYASNGTLSEKTEYGSSGSLNRREAYENGKIKTTFLEDDILYEEYFYDINGRLEKYVSYVTVWVYEKDGLNGYTEFMGKRDNADEIPDDVKGDTHVEIRESITTYIYDGNGNVVFEKNTSIHNYTTETSYEYISLADYRAQGLHLVLPTPDGGSGSGSSSAGNTGNSSGNNAGTGIPCVWCEDTPGKIDCFACEGTGKEFKEFDKNGNKVMKTCTYRGCSYGKIKCPYCGGDGIFGN